MSGPDDGGHGPAQAWEDRMKAWVRSHRWQAGLLYAGPVALASLGFVISVSDDGLRVAVIILGAVFTLGTFVFWVTLGPRLASRPYDRRRSRRGALLLFALLSMVGLVVGFIYGWLSR
jgi:hypothetical protein